MVPRRSLKAEDVVAFNLAAEEEFLAIVREMIEEDGGEVLAVEVQQEACFRLDVSPETAKRYLFKFTARSAPFINDGGKVRARTKPKHKPRAAE